MFCSKIFKLWGSVCFCLLLKLFMVWSKNYVEENDDINYFKSNQYYESTRKLFMIISYLWCSYFENVSFKICCSPIYFSQYKGQTAGITKCEFFKEFYWVSSYFGTLLWIFPLVVKGLVVFLPTWCWRLFIKTMQDIKRLFKDLIDIFSFRSRKSIVKN